MRNLIEKERLNESEMNSLITMETLGNLNESLGISKEVLEHTNLVVSQSNSMMKEIPKKIWNEYSKYKEGLFKHKMFGIDITCHIRFFYVDSLEDKDKLLSDTRIITAYIPNEHKLCVDTVIVDGKRKVSEYKDTIQHEIEHIYQYSFSKNNEIMSKKHRGLYDVSRILMSYDNRIIQLIGNAIYLSFSKEQEAFVQEFYSFLKRHSNEGWMDVYHKSTLYKQIKQVEELYVYLKNGEYDERLFSILKNYNITHKKLLKICGNVIDDLTWRAGRTIALVKQEDGLENSKILT